MSLRYKTSSELENFVLEINHVTNVTTENGIWICKRLCDLHDLENDLQRIAAHCNTVQHVAPSFTHIGLELAGLHYIQRESESVRLLFVHRHCSPGNGACQSRKRCLSISETMCVNRVHYDRCSKQSQQPKMHTIRLSPPFHQKKISFARLCYSTRVVCSILNPPSEILNKFRNRLAKKPYYRDCLSCR